MRGVTPGQLSRFEPFAGLNRNILLALCRHARLVEVPAGRWLLRPGRSLKGSHFLFQGTLRTLDPDRIVHAGGAFAREPIYPGAAGLKTLSDSQLLRLTEDGMSLLKAEEQTALPTVISNDDCWQLQFLQSHLVAALPKSLWQRVLTKLSPLMVDAGELIISEGTLEERACYIMGSPGRAVVTVRGRSIHQLSAGDLFGEDALISAQPRNASVRMTESGAIMRLEAGPFQDFLTEVLASGAFEEPRDLTYSNADRQVFEVLSVQGLRERIAGLCASVTYLVKGVNPKSVALALFLLRKRGLRAWSLI